MFYQSIKHRKSVFYCFARVKSISAARAFYISLVFSNACRVLSQCNTRLRLLYLLIIIKFPYNGRSDWLKQRALSENRARVDDGKLASSNFCFGILINLTQIKHALWLTQMQWKRAICLQ